MNWPQYDISGRCATFSAFCWPLCVWLTHSSLSATSFSHPSHWDGGTSSHQVRETFPLPTLKWSNLVSKLKTLVFVQAFYEIFQIVCPGVYVIVECSCQVSLAFSIFLTLSLTVERFQVIMSFKITNPHGASDKSTWCLWQIHMGIQKNPYAPFWQIHIQIRKQVPLELLTNPHAISNHSIHNIPKIYI